MRTFKQNFSLQCFPAQMEDSLESLNLITQDTIRQLLIPKEVQFESTEREI